MTITRRSFLGYCIASAAALQLTSLDLLNLRAALANPNGPTVIWLHGSGCSGCSISFLNRVPEDTDAALSIPSLSTADLLTGSSTATNAVNATSSVNLVYHAVLMAAAGDTAASAALNAAASGPYILVIEGGVSTAFGGACCSPWYQNGEDVPFQKVVADFATNPNATSIVAIGTCAAFGGVSASGANVPMVVGVSEYVKSLTNKTVLNISGCPPHPNWIVWGIAQLLLGNTNISLDAHNRPLALYGKEVHANCPRNQSSPTFDAASNVPHASQFGVDNACLIKLGCNGPGTYSPCPSMRWNNGANWCVDANANCLGCVEPTFPNASGNPDFYTVPNS